MQTGSNGLLERDANAATSQKSLHTPQGSHTLAQTVVLSRSGLI